MKMDSNNVGIVKLGSFTLAGLTLRTDNTEAGLGKITKHWENFFSQGISEKLGMGQGAEIWEAYFDYERDAGGAYTLLLGSQVSPSSSLSIIGLETHSFPAARYAKFHLEDPKSIRAAWQHIWSRQDLKRLYACDFERIRSNSADIYVSLQP